MVILVGGRAALSRVGGVPSVVRHVAAAERLGLAPIVVFPASLGALGAETAGILAVLCPFIVASAVADYLPAEEPWTLASAADWYLSFGTTLSFKERTSGPARARVVERGAPAAPLARVATNSLATLCDELATTPAALLLERATRTAIVFEPESTDQQRLGDDASQAAAEEKLLASVFGRRSLLDAGRPRRELAALLAPPLASLDSDFTWLSMLKNAAGLVAALLLLAPGYGAGIAGALFYFAVRILDGALALAARAVVGESAWREKLDAGGDTVMQIAVLWAIALRPDAPPEATLLAAFACLGLVVATGLAWSFVLRDIWAAHSTRSLVDEPADEFLSRFVQRDGVAVALLFAALLGRLDLFLWGAAAAAHLFYILWLLARSRRSASPPALRAAG